MATNPIEKALNYVKLSVLVFGPDPSMATKHPRKKQGKLAKKRIEIRDWLLSEGHTATFPEDIYDASSTGAMANVAFQEIAMMRNYDMIVALIEAPGSLTELGYLAGDPEIAQKTHVFLDQKYLKGFAFQAAESIQLLKGEFDSYEYPKDITECNLRTKVTNTVETLAIAKYLTN